MLSLLQLSPIIKYSHRIQFGRDEICNNRILQHLFLIPTYMSTIYLIRLYLANLSILRNDDLIEHHIDAQLGKSERCDVLATMLAATAF